MACNGHNHPPGCDCGWGGDTGIYGPISKDIFISRDLFGSISIERFLNPNAQCPVCGEKVYFYRSPDGGSVYFDELGSPWPKHPCMDVGPVSHGSLFSFFQANGVDMKPDQAVKLAAELVKYAMTNFREPERDFPNSDVMDARAELLKWMFRRHSTGEDYLLPLDEFHQILNYLEKSAQSTIMLNKCILEDVDRTSDELSKEKFQRSQEKISKSKGTLALISQFRAHYDQESFTKALIIKEVEID